MKIFICLVFCLNFFRAVLGMGEEEIIKSVPQAKDAKIFTDSVTRTKVKQWLSAYIIGGDRNSLPAGVIMVFGANVREFIMNLDTLKIRPNPGKPEVFEMCFGADCLSYNSMKELGQISSRTDKEELGLKEVMAVVKKFSKEFQVHLGDENLAGIRNMIFDEVVVESLPFTLDPKKTGFPSDWHSVAIFLQARR